jgi:DNA-binding IclR family transcriptional regulator
MLRVRNPKSADVGVLTKVLRILEVLQKSPSGADLRQISREAGINKSTAYRFLAHLERAGYLLRDSSGAYMIGIKLFQLGARVNPQDLLQKMSRPILQELWKTTGETVNLGVVDAGAVLYVAVLESPHEFRLASTVGTRRPLYATALGKALTAFLPARERQAVLNAISFTPGTPHTITSLVEFEEELGRVRERGYAVDNEEAVVGARCIAVPVLNSNRETVAAISVASPSTRLGLEKVPLFAAAVGEAAQAIAARMGFKETRTADAEASRSA